MCLHPGPEGCSLTVDGEEHQGVMVTSVGEEKELTVTGRGECVLTLLVVGAGALATMAEEAPLTWSTAASRCPQALELKTKALSRFAEILQSRRRPGLLLAESTF